LNGLWVRQNTTAELMNGRNENGSRGLKPR
jgi:hypothetical protein